MIGSTLKSGMVLGLAATLVAAAVPARAGDGGAIAAGIIGGTALGVIAGAAIAGPPPPPPGYYGPPPGYYEPPPLPSPYYDPAAADGPGPYYNDSDGTAPGLARHCARWRNQPDANGNPVCLHYFQ